MNHTVLIRLPTMKRIRVSFLVISLFLLLLRCSTTQAQEAPFAVVEKFDTSVSYRTDLCDRQRLLWNNSIALPDALRGLNLTVSLTNYQTGKEKFFFTLKDGKIPEEDTALFTLILDEVSRRAGFSWRNSFIVYEPRNSTTDGDKTWTDILLWATEVVDISMEKWAHTVDRLSEGVAFPVGFFDSSMVLGEVFEPSQNKPVVDLWSFLKPFEANLWGTIVATITFSGMLYWAIERWNRDAEKRDPDNKSFGAAVFYAAMSFTAHFEHEPISHSTRILSFSLTFWALIVASSYTANMASFLVSPRIAVYKYPTVDAILRQDATVCVQGGAALEMMLNEKYPSMRTVGKDSEEEIFQGLRLPPRRGGCDAVAHQFNVFELYEHDKDINYDCAISSEKRVVEILPSGMATAIVDKCTSLISAVLDYHLTSMIDDGFIETTWENHLNRHGSIDCVRDLVSCISCKFSIFSRYSGSDLD